MSTTWYDGLSAEDKATVDQHQTSLRAAMGELARAIVNMQAVADFYNAEASAVYAGATGTDEIPNPGGLTQAVHLTQAETLSLQTDINTIIATGANDLNSDPRRQNRVRAAGLPNTV